MDREEIKLAQGFNAQANSADQQAVEHQAALLADHWVLSAVQQQLKAQGERLLRQSQAADELNRWLIW